MTNKTLPLGKIRRPERPEMKGGELIFDEVNLIRIGSTSSKENKIFINSTIAIEVRTDGPFVDCGLYLSSAYEWSLVRDECGTTILVPTRKI